MSPSLIVIVCLIQTVAGGFFYTDGNTVCGGTSCPEVKWYRYYTCSKDNQCEFQLQGWLFILLVGIAISILCSLVCSFLRCLFCGCCDRK